MNRILIKNAILDGAEKNILIEGNLISRITPSGVEPDVQATGNTRVVEAKNKAVIPGLVNMHTHSAMTLMRGIFEDASLDEWLSYIWKVEPRLDDELIYWGTRLACLEMIKSGTTTFNDQYWKIGTAVKAIGEMGLRSVNPYVFLDLNDTSKDEFLKEECMRIHEESASWNELNTFAIAIHAPYSVSERLMLWASDYARKNSLLLHIHLSETRKEQQDSMKLHNLSPTRYLESLGILAPNVIAAHCVWMSDNDIELAAAHDIKIVHNINSNLKLASGYKFRYKEFRDAGLTVTLGTDGCASSNNLDMLEAMKTAALVQKAWREDPTVLPLDELMEIATVNGARALNIDSGVIAEGKLADMVLIDIDNYAFTPNYNFLANLVYSANSSCVDTVICNGNIVMEGRRVKDEELILENVRRIYGRLQKSR